MIAYLDTSVLARALLPDEPGHRECLALLLDDTIARCTGSLTRLELTSALTRAAHTGRGDADPAPALRAAAQLLAPGGRITVVSPPEPRVQAVALDLVAEHRLRTMDAWHLACASLTLPHLAEPDEDQAFATRDAEQAAAARALGFTLL